MRVPGEKKIFKVLVEMQQGETECDKHNLFYAHAFSNENNFAHLQHNEIGRICDEKENFLDLATDDTLPSNARNSCTCEIIGGILP